MPLKLVLELSDSDLGYYRQIMEETCERNAKRGEKAILEEARRLLDRAQHGEGPEYVRRRLSDLGTLIALLEDPEWPLEDRERGRIMAAISYFAEPEDMIPDKIPGLGFLDDALMAEIVIDELKHDLEGYREFSEYRKQQEAIRGKEAHVSREDWLGERRRQIFLRIKRRQEERRRHGSTESPTDPILAYRSYPY